MTEITHEALEALNQKATQGVWEVDSEYDDDALYSGGGGCGSGFKNYFIGADVDGKWKTLLDTVNSDHKLVEEEFDEDGKHAWDVIGQANADFIVALVNAYRTGQLILAQPSGDEVEAVAELQLAAFLAGRGSVVSMEHGTRTAKPAPTMDEFRQMARTALDAHRGKQACLKARENGDG